MGKVCSKAQGLRYVDEDDFVGARLGPEGECMSSQDSIPHVHCSGSVGSVNTEICKAKEVETEAGQAVYKKVSDEKGLCTARSLDTNKVALLDECDLIVELPPEGQKSEEKFKSETDVRIKTENKDTEHFSCYSTKEENQNCSNEPKSRQDEWSYTVYDIDGGSNVTDQDLSHVMHSIRSAIGQSVDPNVCVTAKDNKMLRIKVAVGHHNAEENKTEKKQPRDFSRMILPPPDSEEAETLCYYIREKLMSYVNEGRSPTRDFYKERKRSRRRNRFESGLSSRSPDSTNETAPESEQKKTHTRRNPEPGIIGMMETSFTTHNKSTTTNNGLSRNSAPGDKHLSRPSNGLPQRQDTYGGPVETLIDTAARLREKPSCHSACETPSPQCSVKGGRLDGEHYTKNPNQQNLCGSAESSFVHKDTYREGKNARVRNSKRSADRDKITDSRSEKTEQCRGFPLENSLCVYRDPRHNNTKTCPCKYRGKRSPRGRKSRSPENIRNPQERSLEPNTQPIERNEATGQRETSPLRTELVTNGDNVPLIDKTRPHDDLRSHDQEHRTVVNRQTEMLDGYHSPSRNRPYEAGIPPGNRMRDTENRSRDENWSHDGREPINFVRSRDKRRLINCIGSRDEQSSTDDVRSRDERMPKNVQTAESSSDNSTEISQNSSWKEQTPLVSSNCYASLHEWGSKRDLSTNAMLDVMRGQELITSENITNIQEPSSPGKNIGTPEHEVVHRHEHHHYHYHIFKRS